MNLNTYIRQTGVGAVTALARQIGVSPVLVSQWKNGVRPVPAEHCPKIERATGRAVRCEELLPDVDWGYLRESACVPPGEAP